MPATASTTSDGARLTGQADASLFDRRHVVVAWTLFALGCTIVMFVHPQQGTIPYHLGWAGPASRLPSGLATWSRWQLVFAITWYTIGAGLAFERDWLSGDISWDETTEIPLMLLLALMMVWHIRRRQAALAHVTRLAERDVQASLDREQLTQLTSHELRTPLTIARGYVELLQTRVTELEDQQDLSVVADELERLSRVSDRLIRMIRLQDDTTSEIVDIDQVMEQAVERWQVVADRRWVLDAAAGLDVGSPERLRTRLDTLVENAIRYTGLGLSIVRALAHTAAGRCTRRTRRKAGPRCSSHFPSRRAWAVCSAGCRGFQVHAARIAHRGALDCGARRHGALTLPQERPSCDAPFCADITRHASRCRCPPNRPGSVWLGCPLCSHI